MRRCLRLSNKSIMLASLVERHGLWLRYVYSVVPVPLHSVPFGFQRALALLPLLIIEVLFVFLFSAWFLRRKPWAASSNKMSRWIILILATVIWLSPELTNSLLRQFSRAPESGIVLAITLHVAVLAVLCLMSARLRESPRRWNTVLAISLVRHRSRLQRMGHR